MSTPQNRQEFVTMPPVAKKSNYRRVLFTFLSAAIILAGTVLAIRFAQGDRPTTRGEIRETGLLVANSFPNGAQVYVNGKLTTATDDTFNLDPGEYQVRIQKDGYITWEKTLEIQRGLVTQTNAVLFPAVPSLTPLTFTGVQNLTPAPDGQKLIYYTSSASAATKNGLYLVDLTDSPLSLQRGPRQIATETQKIDLATAEYIWSPDSSQVMITDGDTHMLLDITKTNDLNTVPDVSLQRKTIFSDWEAEMTEREALILAKFPPEMIAIATSSATNVYYSPDQKKLLYTATQELTLPDDILPAKPAASTQPQERELKPGNVYVYDSDEDRNFKVGSVDLEKIGDTKTLLSHSAPISATGSAQLVFNKLQHEDSLETAKNFKRYYSGLFSQELQWFPNSTHLIRRNADKITILEYDGTNEMTVYAGPFDTNFVYPWSNGDKMVISTSFNQAPGAEKNLYVIGLK